MPHALTPTQLHPFSGMDVPWRVEARAATQRSIRPWWDSKRAYESGDDAYRVLQRKPVGSISAWKLITARGFA